MEGRMRVELPICHLFASVSRDVPAEKTIVAVHVLLLKAFYRETWQKCPPSRQTYQLSHR